VGAAADEPHEGHAEQTEDHERRQRVAGQADQRHLVEVGEQRGLAGPHGQPVAPDGPEVGHDGRGGVARADGGARGDDQDVRVRAGLLEDGAERRRVVGHDGM
jgi:hypothetical protein